MSDFFRISQVFAHFPDTECVESEIRYYGKYREVIVDFCVQSVSFDIEIVREDLYEKYRNQRRCDFSRDLRDSVGIDGSIGHGLSNIEKLSVAIRFLNSESIVPIEHFHVRDFGMEQFWSSRDGNIQQEISRNGLEIIILFLLLAR